MNLKKEALTLAALDDKEIVKVAGIIKRLQNWLKALWDPAYRQELGEFKNNSAVISSLATQLETATNELLSAIKDADMETYEKKLKEVRQLSKEIAVEVESVKDHTANEFLRFYTKEELQKDPEQIKEKIRSQAPTGMPPFGKLAEGIKLSEFTWFSKLTPQAIYITPGAGQNLLNKIIQRVPEYLKENVANYVNGNWEHFLDNFRGAILQGNLLSYQPAEPGKGMANRPAGQNEAWIDSGEFDLLPGMKAKANVIVIDMGAMDPPRVPPLSLRRVNNVTLDVTKFAPEWKKPPPKEKPKSKSKQDIIDLENFDDREIDYPDFDEVRAARKEQYLKFALSQEVPYKLNQLSDVEFARVLKEGYKKVFGEDPSLETLGVAWAQGVLEAGKPINLPNNNIGNIKATDEWIKSGNPYFIKDAQEFNKNRQSYIQKGAKWKAYATPEDGAAGYWRLIGKRYQPALASMQSGNPKEAAENLGRLGWYTADANKYGAGMSGLFKEFVSKVAPGLGMESKTAPSVSMSSESPANDTDQLISALLSAASLNISDRVKLASCNFPQSSILVSFSSLYPPCEKFEMALEKNVKDLLGGTIAWEENEFKKEAKIEVLGNRYHASMAVGGIMECLKRIYTCKLNKQVEYQILVKS